MSRFPPKPVAYLNVLEGRRPGNKTNQIPIYGSELFFIGRSEVVSQHLFTDPTISNQHLQIHCILYEQDPKSQIAPFVYATDLSTNGTCIKKANAECSSSQGSGVGIRMRRNDKFLLDDGDKLCLAGSVTLEFYAVNPAREVMLEAHQLRERDLFASHYLITGRVLGEGGYGKVLVGIDQDTQHQLACKIVDLTKLWSTTPDPKQLHERNPNKAKQIWPDRVAKTFREFEILKDLSHPNIISVRKVFWSSKTIYIFQDLVAGGDLFSYQTLHDEYRIPEDEAVMIVRQIVIGVEYLHEQGISHRDLKPENILLSSPDPNARVIITDFGHARHVSSPRAAAERRLAPGRMVSITGTLPFTAPEIHKSNKTIPKEHGYSKCVDMWSIGVITMQVLSGEVPFADWFTSRSDPSYDHALLASAAECDLSFLDDARNRTWVSISPWAKSFIKGLVVLNEGDRMTAAAALHHSWISNQPGTGGAPVRKFNTHYFKSIQDWQPRTPETCLVESLLDLSPESYEDSLPHERELSQDLALYFTPSHKSSSLELGQRPRHVPRNALSSIEETGEDYPQSQDECSQTSDSVQRTSPQDSPLDDSIGQLSLSNVDDGRYETNNDAQIYASPAAPNDSYGSQSDHNVPAQADSLYDFSIPPPPPPESQEDEEDDWEHVLETSAKPTRTYGKRPAVAQPDNSQGYDGQRDTDYHDQRSTAYFSRDLAKRRKVLAKYH